MKSKAEIWRYVTAAELIDDLDEATSRLVVGGRKGGKLSLESTYDETSKQYRFKLCTNEYSYYRVDAAELAISNYTARLDGFDWLWALSRLRTGFGRIDFEYNPLRTVSPIEVHIDSSYRFKNLKLSQVLKGLQQLETSDGYQAKSGHRRFDNEPPPCPATPPKL